MQYAALIYATEGSDDVDRDTLMKQYLAFNDEAEAADVVRGGEELAPISTATSLTVRNGKTTITDGPFAETKEVLGGFYLFECDSLDEALQWAAKLPSARYGTVEVRPIVEYEG